MTTLAAIAHINPPKDAIRLGDADPVSFIPMSDVSESGRWETRQTRPLGEVRQGYTYFREGDTLFAKITPCMENGKGCLASGLINGIGFGSTEFHILRAKPDADPRFVFQWTVSRNLRDRAASQMTGSAGQQRVPETFLRDFPIPVLSKAEQIAVAEVLTTIDQTIDQTEAMIAKHKRIQDGMMHDLLTRGIDEQGQLGSSLNGFTDENGAGAEQPAPSHWRPSTVERELDPATGFTLGQHRRPDRNRRQYLRVGNVYRDGILLDDISELEAEDREMAGRVLETADLLVVEGHADPWEVGRCGLVPAAAAGLTFQNHLFRLRSKGINPVFAWAWMNGQYVRRFWWSHCRTSSGLNTINQALLRSLPIYVPLPDEQRRIADVILNVRSVITTEEEQLAKLLSVRTGLMQELLTGKVSVEPLLAQAEQEVTVHDPLQRPTGRAPEA